MANSDVLILDDNLMTADWIGKFQKDDKLFALGAVLLPSRGKELKSTLHSRNQDVAIMKGKYVIFLFYFPLVMSYHFWCPSTQKLRPV